MVVIVGFIKKTRWLPSEKVMKNYPDGTYEVCDVGIRTVHTKDIIGLGLRPRDIANDNKMKRLRQSVATKGWKDESPIDLHLYLTPDGKYAVWTGGNHRPYLADELRIPSIEASVDVVIPKGKIFEKTANEIDTLRRNYQNLEKEANELNKLLQPQRFRQGGYNDADENKLNAMFDQLTSIHNQVEMLLKKEAYHLGYIPEDWVQSDS
ncbi:hypothetical protein MH215_10190 [Paenibacillus sp. ACRSA]|uniref:hypothetical protein n=1 Tax=Paenibacillus sp. ACRSA TaxID=2918211 RepID=UPI001EF4027F|nr:hypothetical protein [Paenibacillus sp. ACRSA]MCG7377365.1 hypothetical protein [Paenibacillus sp. ACRSA]